MLIRIDVYNFICFLLSDSFHWEDTHVSNTQDSIWPYFQTPRRLLKVVFSVFWNIVKHGLCLIYHLRLESLKRKSNNKISASSVDKVSKVKLLPCILGSKGMCWHSKCCLSKIYKPRLLGLLTSRLWHSYRGYMAHQVWWYIKKLLF